MILPLPAYCTRYQADQFLTIFEKEYIPFANTLSEKERARREKQLEKERDRETKNSESKLKTLLSGDELLARLKKLLERLKHISYTHSDGVVYVVESFNVPVSSELKGYRKVITSPALFVFIILI